MVHIPILDPDPVVSCRAGTWSFHKPSISNRSGGNKQTVMTESHDRTQEYAMGSQVARKSPALAVRNTDSISRAGGSPWDRETGGFVASRKLMLERNDKIGSIGVGNKKLIGGGGEEIEISPVVTCRAVTCRDVSYHKPTNGLIGVALEGADSSDCSASNTHTHRDSSGKWQYANTQSCSAPKRH